MSKPTASQNNENQVLNSQLPLQQSNTSSTQHQREIPNALVESAIQDSMLQNSSDDIHNHEQYFKIDTNVQERLILDAKLFQLTREFFTRQCYDQFYSTQKEADEGIKRKWNANHKKNHSNLIKNELSEPWICQVCTFENTISKTNCEMCDTVNPNAFVRPLSKDASYCINFVQYMDQFQYLKKYNIEHGNSQQEQKDQYDNKLVTLQQLFIDCCKFDVKTFNQKEFTYRLRKLVVQIYQMSESNQCIDNLSNSVQNLEKIMKNKLWDQNQIDGWINMKNTASRLKKERPSGQKPYRYTQRFKILEKLVMHQYKYNPDKYQQCSSMVKTQNCKRQDVYRCILNQFCNTARLYDIDHKQIVVTNQKEFIDFLQSKKIHNDYKYKWINMLKRYLSHHEVLHTIFGHFQNEVYNIVDYVKEMCNILPFLHSALVKQLSNLNMQVKQRDDIIGIVISDKKYELEDPSLSQQRAKTKSIFGVKGEALIDMHKKVIVKMNDQSQKKFQIISDSQANFQQFQQDWQEGTDNYRQQQDEVYQKEWNRQEKLLIQDIKQYILKRKQEMNDSSIIEQVQEQAYQNVTVQNVNKKVKFNNYDQYLNVMNEQYRKELKDVEIKTLDTSRPLQMDVVYEPKKKLSPVTRAGYRSVIKEQKIKDMIDRGQDAIQIIRDRAQSKITVSVSGDETSSRQRNKKFVDNMNKHQIKQQKRDKIARKQYKSVKQILAEPEDQEVITLSNEKDNVFKFSYFKRQDHQPDYCNGKNDYNIKHRPQKQSESAFQSRFTNLFQSPLQSQVHMDYSYASDDWGNGNIVIRCGVFKPCERCVYKDKQGHIINGLEYDQLTVSNKDFLYMYYDCTSICDFYKDKKYSTQHDEKYQIIHKKDLIEQPVEDKSDLFTFKTKARLNCEVKNEQGQRSIHRIEQGKFEFLSTPDGGCFMHALSHLGFTQFNDIAAYSDLQHQYDMIEQLQYEVTNNELEGIDTQYVRSICKDLNIRCYESTYIEKIFNECNEQQQNQYFPCLIIHRNTTGEYGDWCHVFLGKRQDEDNRLFSIRQISDSFGRVYQQMKEKQNPRSKIYQTFSQEIVPSSDDNDLIISPLNKKDTQKKNIKQGKKDGKRKKYKKEVMDEKQKQQQQQQQQQSDQDSLLNEEIDNKDLKNASEKPGTNNDQNDKEKSSDRTKYIYVKKNKQRQKTTSQQQHSQKSIFYFQLRKQLSKYRQILLQDIDNEVWPNWHNSDDAIRVFHSHFKLLGQDVDYNIPIPNAQSIRSMLLLFDLDRKNSPFHTKVQKKIVQQYEIDQDEYFKYFSRDNDDKFVYNEQIKNFDVQYWVDNKNQMYKRTIQEEKVYPKIKEQQISQELNEQSISTSKDIFDGKKSQLNVKNVQQKYQEEFDVQQSIEKEKKKLDFLPREKDIQKDKCPQQYINGRQKKYQKYQTQILQDDDYFDDVFIYKRYDGEVKDKYQVELYEPISTQSEIEDKYQIEFYEPISTQSKVGDKYQVELYEPISSFRDYIEIFMLTFSTHLKIAIRDFKKEDFGLDGESAELVKKCLWEIAVIVDATRYSLSSTFDQLEKFTSQLSLIVDDTHTQLAVYVDPKTIYEQILQWIKILDLTNQLTLYAQQASIVSYDVGQQVSEYTSVAIVYVKQGVQSTIQTASSIALQSIEYTQHGYQYTFQTASSIVQNTMQATSSIASSTIQTASLVALQSIENTQYGYQQTLSTASTIVSNSIDYTQYGYQYTKDEFCSAGKDIHIQFLNFVIFVWNILIKMYQSLCSIQSPVLYIKQLLRQIEIIIINFAEHMMQGLGYLTPQQYIRDVIFYGSFVFSILLLLYHTYNQYKIMNKRSPAQFYSPFDTPKSFKVKHGFTTEYSNGDKLDLSNLLDDITSTNRKGVESQPIYEFTQAKIYNGIVQPPKMTTNLNGTFQQSFLKTAKQRTMITQKQIDNGAQTGSPHSEDRFISHDFQRQCLEKMATKIIADAQNGTPTTIICVGDKNYSRAGILERLFKIDLSASPFYFKDAWVENPNHPNQTHQWWYNNTLAGQQYIFQQERIREIYQQAKDPQLRPNNQLRYDYIFWQFRQLVDINNNPSPLVTDKEGQFYHCMNFIEHISVRPNDEKYDKEYNSQNTQKYLNKYQDGLKNWDAVNIDNSQENLIKHSTYACTIQEFDGSQPAIKCNLLNASFDGKEVFEQFLYVTQIVIFSLLFDISQYFDIFTFNIHSFSDMSQHSGYYSLLYYPIIIMFYIIRTLSWIVRWKQLYILFVWIFYRIYLGSKIICNVGKDNDTLYFIIFVFLTRIGIIRQPDYYNWEQKNSNVQLFIRWIIKFIFRMIKFFNPYIQLYMFFNRNMQQDDLDYIFEPDWKIFFRMTVRLRKYEKQAPHPAFVRALERGNICYELFDVVYYLFDNNGNHWKPNHRPKDYVIVTGQNYFPYIGKYPHNWRNGHFIFTGRKILSYPSGQTNDPYCHDNVWFKNPRTTLTTKFVTYYGDLCTTDCFELEKWNFGFTNDKEQSIARNWADDKYETGDLKNSAHCKGLYSHFHGLVTPELLFQFISNIRVSSERVQIVLEQLQVLSSVNDIVISYNKHTNDSRLRYLCMMLQHYWRQNVNWTPMFGPSKKNCEYEHIRYSHDDTIFCFKNKSYYDYLTFFVLLYILSINFNIHNNFNFYSVVNSICWILTYLVAPINGKLFGKDNGWRTYNSYFQDLDGRQFDKQSEVLKEDFDSDDIIKNSIVVQPLHIGDYTIKQTYANGKQKPNIKNDQVLINTDIESQQKYEIKVQPELSSSKQNIQQQQVLFRDQHVPDKKLVIWAIFKIIGNIIHRRNRQQIIKYNNHKKQNERNIIKSDDDQKSLSYRHGRSTITWSEYNSDFIGSGHFGKVFKAVSKDIGTGKTKNLAVKKMDYNNINNKISNNVHEIDILKQLKGLDNVLQFIDSFIYSDMNWITKILWNFIDLLLQFAYSASIPLIFLTIYLNLIFFLFFLSITYVCLSYILEQIGGKKYIYIITEFADEGNLAEYIQFNQILAANSQIQDWKTGKLKDRYIMPCDQICFITGMIITGYKSLNNITHNMHNDIKFDNLLGFRIEDANKKQSVIFKLADFGQSCPDIYTDTDKSCYDFQQTIGYASPEKLQGKGFNSKNDVFSLGVMMYMMMYGEHPFIKTSPNDFNMSEYLSLLKSQEYQELQLPRLENKYPKSLVSLLRLCLAINPDNRISWQQLYKFDFQYMANQLNSGQISEKELDPDIYRVAEPRTMETLNKVLKQMTQCDNYKVIAKHFQLLTKSEKFKFSGPKQQFIHTPVIDDENYSASMKPTNEEFDHINTLVIGTEETTEAFLNDIEALRDMTNAHDGRYTIHKNKIHKSDKKFKGNNNITRAGFDLVENGEKVYVHSFNHKDFDNKSKAIIGRQLGARQTYTQADLARFRITTKRYMQWIQSKLDEHPMETDTHTFMDYVAGQHQWGPAKKNQYELGILRAFFDESYVDLKASYEGVVKPDEQYKRNQLPLNPVDGDNEYVNNDPKSKFKSKHRARLVCVPSKNGLGIIQSIQSYLFPWIRKHIPSFIHSANTTQMIDHFKKHIGNENWRSISTDCSAYDSSQFSELMSIVDDELMSMFEPYIEKILEYNIGKLHRAPTNSLKIIKERVMKALKSDENHIFLHFPGIGKFRKSKLCWSDRVIKRFRRDIDFTNSYKYPEDDWMFLNIKGTTFSGLSTRTTLGNTFRGLAYVYYYIIDAGISDEPWNDPRIFIIQSGDDCVVFCVPELEIPIRNAIYTRTTRTTDRFDVQGNLNAAGVGQCVKKISSGHYSEMDFCSKKSYCRNKDFNSWKLCRDISKIFQKKWFTGKNKRYLQWPYVYLLGMLIALIKEGLGHLLEDLVYSMLQGLEIPPEWLALSHDQQQDILSTYKQLYYANVTDCPYQYEQDINEDYQIGIDTLWIANLKHVIEIGTLNGYLKKKPQQQQQQQQQQTKQVKVNKKLQPIKLFQYVLYLIILFFMLLSPIQHQVETVDSVYFKRQIESQKQLQFTEINTMTEEQNFNKLENIIHAKAKQKFKGKRYKFQDRNGKAYKTYDPTMGNVRNLVSTDPGIQSDMKEMIGQVKNLIKGSREQSDAFLKRTKQNIGSSVLQAKFNNPKVKKAIALNNTNYLNDGEIRKVLESAFDGPMAGQVFSTLSPWLKSGTKWAAKKVVDHGLPWLKEKYNSWKKTGQGNQVLDTVRDWTGYDIHDWKVPYDQDGDVGALNTGYQAVQQGYSKDADRVMTYGNYNKPQHMLDGVCIGSIQSSLCPELYQHVVPTSNKSMQTLSKKISQIITTDANGNALIAIHPINICSKIAPVPLPGNYPGMGAFITTNGTGTYDPATGTLSQPAYINGPYADATDVLGQFEIVGFTVQIVITQAPINQKGLIYFAYSQKGFTKYPYDGQATTAGMKTGIDQLTAASFCMVNSVNMSNKTQITMAPLTLMDDMRWTYNIPPEDLYFYKDAKETGKDQFIIAISGAVPKTEIGTIFMYPNIQFVPSIDKIEYYTLIMPPVGNQTLQVMSQIVLLNKNILTLGPQEMTQYCRGLGAIAPSFNSVICYTNEFLALPHISPGLLYNTGTGTHPGPGMSTQGPSTGFSPIAVYSDKMPGYKPNTKEELNKSLAILMKQIEKLQQHAQSIDDEQYYDTPQIKEKTSGESDYDEVLQEQRNKETHATNGNISPCYSKETHAKNKNIRNPNSLINDNDYAIVQALVNKNKIDTPLPTDSDESANDG